MFFRRGPRTIRPGLGIPVLIAHQELNSVAVGKKRRRREANYAANCRCINPTAGAAAISRRPSTESSR